MTTPHRTLLQQALDALDRAISDDRAYIRECKDAAEAIRAHLAAQPAPVPLTDLQLSEIAVSDEFLLYCSQDEFNEIARAIERAHGIAASPAAPAAPVPDALAEAVAKAIYWEWRRDAGYVPWVDGGNSLKQDDARKIARAVVSSAAPVVPLTDERITKALRRAFSLGQTYWQQADSDSYKQNVKSDETRQKFETLIVETLNGITGGKP